MAIALALHLLGWRFPELLAAIAERSVGVILIAVGASVLWLRHSPHGNKGFRRKAPFAIGIVHGMAGSATMLALIPVTLYRPEAGIVYAILFSLGVLAGMLGFGWLFGRGQQFLGDRLPGVRAAVRLLLGVGAVGMGAYWLQAA